MCILSFYPADINSKSLRSSGGGLKNIKKNLWSMISLMNDINKVYV